MKVNQIKAGSLLSYLTLILGTVVSLIYTPVMLERLGQSEYGVYSVVLPMVSYLNLFSFGLGSAYTRFYTRYKESGDKFNMAKLNGMFMIIYSIIGVIVLIVGCTIAANPRLAFGEKLTEEEIALAVRLMYIMTATAAISFPLSVFESNTMVNERYVFLKSLAFIKSVVNPLLIIPLLMIGLRSEAIAYMSLAFTLFSGVLNIWYCFKKLDIRFYFKKFDFSLLGKMFKFTSWVFLGIVVDQLNWSVDKFLLAWMHGSETVAVYNVASQLNILNHCHQPDFHDGWRIYRVQPRIYNKTSCSLKFSYIRFHYAEFYVNGKLIDTVDRHVNGEYVTPFFEAKPNSTLDVRILMRTENESPRYGAGLAGIAEINEK